MRAALWALTLAVAVAGGGCGVRARLTSEAPSTSVVLPSGQSVELPATVRVPWVPFQRYDIEVISPGHRLYTVNLRQRLVRPGAYLTHPLWFTVPRRTAQAEVLLVPVPIHGPPGTWSEADVP